MWLLSAYIVNITVYFCAHVHKLTYMLHVHGTSNMLSTHAIYCPRAAAMLCNVQIWNSQAIEGLYHLGQVTVCVCVPGVHNTGEREGHV